MKNHVSKLVDQLHRDALKQAAASLMRRSVAKPKGTAKAKAAAVPAAPKKSAVKKG